jgi:hypothetical protein
VDYYQGIVADYLNADPTMLVKPECLVRLSDDGRPGRGDHWYCDILAASFRHRVVYLCEVTLSQDVRALIRRLREWNTNWAAVRAAVVRDNLSGEPWSVRPWVFVPEAQRGLVAEKVSSLLDPTTEPHQMPKPLATSLEAVVPWRYSSPLVLPGENETDA